MSAKKVAWQAEWLMWRARLWTERHFLILSWIAFWVTVFAYYVVRSSR